MAELRDYEREEPSRAEPVSIEALTLRYPGVEHDVGDARLWMGGEVDLRLASVPTERFADTATYLQGTYPQFPKERRRTNRIVAALRRGEPAWPVFVDEEDGFILAGRHRIVALFADGRETVEVAFVRPSDH